MSDITKELEEMESLITANTVVPSTESASTSAPGTEAAGTEIPSTESPGTDSPMTESPVTEVSSTEAPTTEVPEEIPDWAKKLIDENAALRTQVEKISGSSTTKAPKTTAPTTNAPMTDEDFLGDIDLDELTRDKDAFNKLLNKVHKKGIEVGENNRKSYNERLIRSIPEIVKVNIATVKSLEKASTDFYNDNPDLKPFKKVVGVVFEEILSDNPDKKYSELMPMLETKVREKLNLKKKAIKKEDTPPRLPGKKRQPRGKDDKTKTDPLLNELEEMDKSLGL